MGLGKHVRKGGFWHGGWTELIGVAYERRMYAFRFDTTEEQDDAFIALMNSRKNHSRFQLLYNNCADFSRKVLNQYFPRTFRRSFFPDAGMTTPKQITYKLERYAKKHPDTHLEIFEIPQVVGYRRMSRTNKGISESLMTTGYAVPLAIINPYLAGGLFVDYVIRGRYHLIPKDLEKLTPESLATLTYPGEPDENPIKATAQVHITGADSAKTEIQNGLVVSPTLKEVPTAHEQQ